MAEFKYGRIKGANWEREFAKLLSLWISDGKDKSIFTRASHSGGSKVVKTGELGFGGDVYAIKEEGFKITKFVSFELKRTKSVLISQIFKTVLGLPPSEQLQLFWRQCRNDAVVCRKLPMLVVKPDYFPIILITLNHEAIVSILRKGVAFLSVLDDNLCVFRLDALFEVPFNIVALGIEEIYVDWIQTCKGS